MSLLHEKECLYKKLDVFQEQMSDRIIGNEGSGFELYQLSLIGGKQVSWVDTYSNKLIYNALVECKEYLKSHEKIYLEGQLNEITDWFRPISGWQCHCAISVLSNIKEKKYNSAIHEFTDCIEDKIMYKGISPNEHCMYNLLIDSFLNSLESEV
jgi:hypothetical protein